jgi:arylsulfatase A-like enzyme
MALRIEAGVRMSRVVSPRSASATIDPAWKLDGVDLMPCLTGRRSDPPHETLFWRRGEQWAVRHGDWKLVVAYGGTGMPELYHLAHDIGESADLADGNAEILRELQSMYDRWNAVQAAPLAPLEKPGPGFEKAVQKKAAEK